MAKAKGYTAAVQAAYARRAGVAGRADVNFEWFIEEVSDKIELTMERRVRLTTNWLQSQVVQNISRPVTKTTTKRVRDTSGFPKGGPVGSQYTKITNRSKPGEFPKADTTQLRKTIFNGTFESSPGVWDGFVGTPLDYGLILEIKMNRSFLVKTLNELKPRIVRLLSGPIK